MAVGQTLPHRPARARITRFEHAVSHACAFYCQTKKQARVGYYRARIHIRLLLDFERVPELNNWPSCARPRTKVDAGVFVRTATLRVAAPRTNLELQHAKISKMCAGNWFPKRVCERSKMHAPMQVMLSVARRGCSATLAPRQCIPIGHVCVIKAGMLAAQHQV